MFAGISVYGLNTVLHWKVPHMTPCIVGNLVNIYPMLPFVLCSNCFGMVKLYCLDEGE